MTANAQLVLGEIVGGKAEPVELPCSIPGVVRALQSRQRCGRVTVTKRLYECANGLALGAQRGGPLHLADAKTWEIFTFKPGPLRITYGESVGWVDEATLERAVTRMAAWFDEPAGATA